MAGHGDCPVSDEHYKATTLTAFALGQCAPDAAQAIRQHLDTCASCRAAFVSEQDFIQSIGHQLHHTLGAAHPTTPISFAPIARGWRQPPRRFALASSLLASLPVALSVAALLGGLALLLLLRDPLASPAPRPNEDHAAAPLHGIISPEDEAAVKGLDSRPAPVFQAAPSSDQPGSLVFAADGRWLAVPQHNGADFTTTCGDSPHLKLAQRDTAAAIERPDRVALASAASQPRKALATPGGHRVDLTTDASTAVRAPRPDTSPGEWPRPDAFASRPLNTGGAALASR